MLLVTRGGKGRADPSMPEGVEDFGGAGEDPETLVPGNLEELCLLSSAKLFSQSFLGFLAENGGDQLVAPLPNLGHDPLRRDLKAEPPEGAAPGLDVPRIGIYQGPVDVEDHSAYGHEGKLVKDDRKKPPDHPRGLFVLSFRPSVLPRYLSPSRIRSTRRPCARGL